MTYFMAFSNDSLPILRHNFKQRFIIAERLAVFLVADSVGFLIAFVAATGFAWIAGKYSFGRTLPTTQIRATLLNDGVIFIVMIFCFAHRAHYTRRLPFWSALQDMVLASFLALFFSGFVQLSMQRVQSRILLDFTWLILPLTLLLARTGARSVLRRLGFWELRTIVVGSGTGACQAQAALLSEPWLGYSVAAIVDQNQFAEPTAAAARELLQFYRAELLIFAFDMQNLIVSRLSWMLLRNGIPFAIMPQLDGLPVLGLKQHNFLGHDSVMFSFKNNLSRPILRMIKIMFDITLASILILITMPMMIVVAAAVKLDGGPIFYSQRRIGMAGREFNCLKFRSMVPNAHVVLSLILAQDTEVAQEWASTQKLRNDPRVTRLGRFLRKTSIDELPQLLNVLCLKMSLVGPRPIVHSEMSHYGDNIAYYLQTRPGITGLWQVSGRSNTGYKQRVHLDSWYVRNWTLWHDIAILAKTVPAVMRFRGAI